MTKRTGSTGAWAAGIVVVLAVGGAGLWYERDRQARRPAIAPPAPSIATPEAATPEITHPIEQAIVDTPDAAPASEPLPLLHESDPALVEALAALFGPDALRALINPDYIVQRVVATIDNLPQRKLAPQLLPVKPVRGPFAASGEGAIRELSVENAARYDRHVALLQAVDTRALVALYVRYYPLFQQAYRELGVPDRYFNDRLIEVIDHLLEAPEATPPYALTRARLFWEFADPRLEGMSAGQKTMLRIGPAHAATVKAKLREIRAALVGQRPVQPSRSPATG